MAGEADEVTVGIVGAGAMGSLLAARLLLAGTPVLLVDRPGSAHLAAVRARGLTIAESDGGERTVAPPVLAGAAVGAATELLIVLVKAWATEAAMAPLRGHLRPGTVVLTLQNGLGNAEAIGRGLGEEADIDLLVGVTSQAALRPAPGRVRHTGSGPTLIGRADGRVEGWPRTIAAMFGRARLATAVVSDIERHVWRKLAVNAAINGLTALAGVPNGGIADDPQLRSAAAAIAAEVEAVARARGMELGDVAAAVEEVARATAANRSSMLRDLETGQRTEVAAIYGAVAAAGAAVGIETPMVRLLAALIGARQERSVETPTGRRGDERDDGGVDD